MRAWPLSTTWRMPYNGDEVSATFVATTILRNGFGENATSCSSGLEFAVERNEGEALAVCLRCGRRRWCR